jgi:hypothetical protein
MCISEFYISQRMIFWTIFSVTKRWRCSVVHTLHCRDLSVICVVRVVVACQRFPLLLSIHASIYWASRSILQWLEIVAIPVAESVTTRELVCAHTARNKKAWRMHSVVYRAAPARRSLFEHHQDLAEVPRQLAMRRNTLIPHVSCVIFSN